MWQGGVMELTSSGVVGFENCQGTHCMEVEVQMLRVQFQQHPSFCVYGVTYAAQSLVIMQCHTPCLRNADPCACAMPTRPCSADPVVIMAFTHWAHPTRFFHVQYKHNYVQSDARYGFRNLSVLKVSCWIALNMQNIHRAGGNQIFQNSAAEHRIPSA